MLVLEHLETGQLSEKNIGDYNSIVPGKKTQIHQAVSSHYLPLF